MASNPSYPQLPSTVWKGVWQILKRTPSRRLDDKALAIELNVQQPAARQYRSELVRLGILNEDSTPTELAGRWRQDGDDPTIINEILETAYPQELRELAPADALDRDKVIRWFLSQKLGEGAAKNKAATYIRIASGLSSIDTPTPSAQGKKAERAAAAAPKSRAVQQSNAPLRSQKTPAGDKTHGQNGRRRPDFNVNVQIHISADASTDQIDAIFAAMSRYFDDNPTS